ncbi:hypothetical protein ACO0R3_000369 [Hanseniaspora guilliermondii]
MLFFKFFLCLIITISLTTAQNGITTGSNILPVIDILGNKFFDSKTNEQFFMKGIAYQPALTSEELSKLSPTDAKFIDPLSDEITCDRDVPLLKKLGVNVIRVYQIDTTKSHDYCMHKLAKNGIYVIADLSEPEQSIVREHPKFTTEIFQRYINVIDVMSQYSNTLGFFAGNEVTNDKTTSLASAYVKASVRDIKAYMRRATADGKIPRSIPVGYSTNDDPDVRLQLMDYFLCNTTPEDSIDFYGVNIYEWCGYSSYVSSGYKERTEEHKDYPIPLFMSEFGCNAYRPRPFTEVEAIFSPVMTNVWSGGLVYMYFEEENQYGIVKRLSPTHVEILPEFENLAKQYNKANPKKVTKSEYLTELKSKAKKSYTCPALSPSWQARGDELPPTPDFEKCKCLDTLPCGLSMPLQTKEMYKQPFDILCDIVDCSDIGYVNGLYGDNSDCSKQEQLSYIMSKVYYLQKGQNGCPLQDLLPQYVKFNEKYATINEANNKDMCSIVAFEASKRSLKKGSDLSGIPSVFRKAQKPLVTNKDRLLSSPDKQNNGKNDASTEPIKDSQNVMKNNKASTKKNRSSRICLDFSILALSLMVYISC